MSRIYAIIPARIGSTRFPAKVLASETGYPLLWHVCQSARGAELIEEVVVATDDRGIRNVMERLGVRTIMTDESHPNGTSRIAEASCQLGLDEDDIVVNVQGDEPELEPSLIDAMVTVATEADTPMATLGSPFEESEDQSDPNIVKLVTNREGKAMYFSRAPIPHDRDATGDAVRYKHVGMYAYRMWFLQKYSTLEPTPLELSECLEQLRVLEHGYEIAVAIERASHHGIDTPEQYRAFVERWRASHPG
ncbi:MAG: 3-deoxy-manno-octulosonate cytidylyltransferase [Planctomycetota bacterium]|jgi:3-deoxy-manno-octulosonate cytidylyltransferase (CMP-KDO synthetase)